MTGVRELMRDRRFALLWLGQAVNTVGHGLTIVALATLLVETHGAGTLGLVLAADSAAMGLTLLAGGVIADRYSRTAVMAVSDVVRSVAVLGYALAPASSPTSPAGLLRGARGLRRGTVPAGLAGGPAAGGAGRPAARGQRHGAADQPRRPAARRRTRRGPGRDGRAAARPAARRGDLHAEPRRPCSSSGCPPSSSRHPKACGPRCTRPAKASRSSCGGLGSRS